MFLYNHQFIYIASIVDKVRTSQLVNVNVNCSLTHYVFSHCNSEVCYAYAFCKLLWQSDRCIAWYAGWEEQESALLLYDLGKFILLC